MKAFTSSMVVLLGLASACVAGDGKLTAAQARKLLPEAAGSSNADFKTLAEGAPPDAIKSKSLSMVLLGLDGEIARQNPDAAKEFRYLGEGIPNLAKLAEAMSLSKNKGYVTFMQPKYIIDCTCESTADRADGIVTFKSALYEGRIPFVAQKTNDGWVITEFRLPRHETKTVRGKDGIWRQAPLKGK